MSLLPEVRQMAAREQRTKKARVFIFQLLSSPSGDLSSSVTPLFLLHIYTGIHTRFIDAALTKTWTCDWLENHISHTHRDAEKCTSIKKNKKTKSDFIGMFASVDTHSYE